MSTDDRRRPVTDHVLRTAARTLGRFPRPLKRVLAGKPTVVDGLELDVEAQLGIRLLGLAVGPTFDELPLDQGRAQIDGEAWVFGEETPVAEIQDISIPGPDSVLAARLYRQDRTASAAPGLVYFHGGGWVLGGLGSCDSVCRFLARAAGVVVVSVDYRLAPEHPFPAAVLDAVAAFTYVADHAAALGIDPTRIAVGGESAGGNLTAVVANETAHRARVEPGAPQPAFQLMFMPVTDLSSKHPSYRLFPDGYFLTEAQMDWYKDRYLVEPQQAVDPRVSPLLEPDVSGVAPAYVAVAGFDVLRDEGEAYAAKLREAGVPVRLRRHDGLVHGLINATGVGSAAKRALAEAAEALRAGLDPTSGGTGPRPPAGGRGDVRV